MEGFEPSIRELWASLGLFLSIKTSGQCWWRLSSRSLPTPEVRGSIPISDINIGQYSTNCNLENTKIKEKEAGKGPSLKKYQNKVDRPRQGANTGQQRIRSFTSQWCNCFFSFSYLAASNSVSPRLTRSQTLWSMATFWEEEQNKFWWLREKIGKRRKKLF